MTEPIFHIAPAVEVRAGTRAGSYSPARLDEDGFVHCAVRDSVLVVAADYFADIDGPVMLLEIDPDRLTARLVFEAAAPIEGGRTAHLATAHDFPHVYGPLNTDSVTGIGLLGRRGDFRWPDRFTPLEAFLKSE